ncbi:protein ImuB [Microbacterium endophyticum]|uniref:Protein ImuB n=1 Tax=Microbacterium endophyticum TaxID=1526412 RepID=A0A7W4V190_9MICO|nr:DNA polymerase Y family protein [Microbacterium endophyticum]MBB2975000.1 protein ImuB [Microbacterium endophyticum]NIK37460.1 protein ImuB [Microbacterium endophyticum]
MAEPVRTLVLWVPDWPIIAAEHSGIFDAAAPVAVVEKNAVVACSATARAEGVRRGQRRRDAQARCPQLTIIATDLERDHRAFAPAVAAVEERAPGVQILRAGLLALRIRGPARYYGGESEAASVLREAVTDLGITDVRAGVADGVFTAERAARNITTTQVPVHIVPPGGSASFLAPMPVAVLEDAEVALLLGRLGVQTLGQFAGLDASRVAERLGPHGERLFALASGRDSRAVDPRTPPPELDREVVFEPPVEAAEHVAFGIRLAASEFIDALGALDLVCTELRVELTGDRAEHSERVWLHPTAFDAAAVVDRVRWQLSEDAQHLVTGVGRVRLSPEAVDAASHHHTGLFGGGPDERVHHALSRVQAMLGHRGVVTPAVGGGRLLAERRVLVPWGDRAVLARERAQPWPGHLPAPLPASVFPELLPVDVTAAGGFGVDVDERGSLTAEPELLIVRGRRSLITSWAGPWPVIEREWDADRAHLTHRFQIVDDDQLAWLLVCTGGVWAAEARYD